jgi:hypothetical protein
MTKPSSVDYFVTDANATDTAVRINHGVIKAVIRIYFVMNGIIKKEIQKTRDEHRG